MTDDYTLVEWYWDPAWRCPTSDDPGDSDLHYAKIGRNVFLAVSGANGMVFLPRPSLPEDARPLSSSYLRQDTYRIR